MVVIQASRAPEGDAENRRRGSIGMSVKRPVNSLKPGRGGSA